MRFTPQTLDFLFENKLNNNKEWFHSQESIVKAFSKIDTLKKDRYAKTWLMRILINECYNIARRINVNESLDEGYAENMKQPKENRDYSELYRAVNELKEELRIPVILYYMEEFNIREIAQILERYPKALYKRDL